MTTQSNNFPSLMKAAAGFALQWRLQLIWLALLLLPTALAVLPIWQILAGQLDHSIYANDLAHHLTANSAIDLTSSAGTHMAAISSGGIAGVILTLLLSPLLSGAAVTAAKSATPLSLGELMQGALSEYWRLLRMLLLALLPLGIALAIAGGLQNLATQYAAKTLLESNADLANHAALLIGIVLFFIADASVDAGRAQFVLSSKRRSAIKAWWRGVKLICRRPVSGLGSYLLLTLVGLLIAAAFGILRINMPQVGALGFIAAFVVTQLIVAAMAWLRGARLFVLVQLAREQQ